MLIIANWKMNPDSLEKALDLFFKEVRWLNWLPKNNKQKIIICPSFVWIDSIRQKYKQYLSENIFLGAQNLSDKESGSCTGEVSATMLHNLDCKYVIIGHSERRSMGEDDKMINKKIQTAIKTGLIPILCVGETKSQRVNNQTKSVIKKQLKAALSNLEFICIKEVVIAYEPIWSVGKIGQKTITKEEVYKMKEFINSTVVSALTDKKININVLYGGSVNSQNVNNFIGAKLMDGVLVGTSSLDYKEFISIIKFALS